MCKVLIFDLDGTLADDVEEHVEAWRRAMEELGIRVSSKELEIYRKHVGKSLFDIMKAIYGDVDTEFFRKVKELKHKHFLRLTKNVKPVVPRYILEELSKGYVIALFTSTNRKTAESLLKALNIDDLFDVIVTSEDVKEAKPNPEGIFKVMERTGCRDVIFVGDTRYDEDAAKRAGVRFLHVKEFLRSWRSLL